MGLCNKIITNCCISGNIKLCHFVSKAKEIDFVMMLWIIALFLIQQNTCSAQYGWELLGTLGLSGSLPYDFSIFTVGQNLIAILIFTVTIHFPNRPSKYNCLLKPLTYILLFQLFYNCNFTRFYKSHFARIRKVLWKYGMQNDV